MLSRVWSAGARREREPGEEEEEEGFYGVPEHPLNQGKSPAARELDPLCGNSSSSKWLLASNPTPGWQSDVLPMKGGAQPLDFHHTLIQAFFPAPVVLACALWSQNSMYWQTA